MRNFDFQFALALIACWCAAAFAQQTKRPPQLEDLLKDRSGDSVPLRQAPPLPEADQGQPRQPIPDQKSVSTSQNLLKELYEDEYAKVSENAEPLIHKLVEASHGTQDPARRYAMLMEAEHVAISSGDATRVAELVDLRAKFFEIDLYASRITLLNQLASVQDELAPMQVSRLCLALKDTSTQALRDKCFQECQKAADLLLRVAKKHVMVARREKDGTREEEAEQYRSDAETLVETASRKLQGFGDFQAAQVALEKDPANQNALLVSAKYLCFVLNDWETGIPMLARSGIPSLAAIAEKELAAESGKDEELQTAEQRYSVANLWWDAAAEKGISTEEADAIKQHAASLYASVQGKLPEQLDNDLSAKRANAAARNVSKDPNLIPRQVGGVFENSFGMRLVYIPSGKFVMGNQAKNNSPVVRVRITRPFLMAETEVTQKQWDAVMGLDLVKHDEKDAMPPKTVGRNLNELQGGGGLNPFQSGGGLGGSGAVHSGMTEQAGLDGGDNENLPVRNITPQEASNFCTKLADIENKSNAIPPGSRYKLPTEAQWEYACRAGTATKFSFGDDSDDFSKYGQASRFAGRSQPMPVKQLLPNPWGLFDMHGNVAEITRSLFAKDLDGGDDPAGPVAGKSIVIRGGGLKDSPSEWCRSDSRAEMPIKKYSPGIGFRVILELPAKKK